MDELFAGSRRQAAITGLLPLFFVSGATALVYQTIWGRELHLVFGTSTFAIATVLAAFMAGLAAGGFAMGRYADSMAHPLRAYGLLEIGIGCYAVVFPKLVDAVTPLYLGFHRAYEPGPVLYGAVQFALVGSTLLLPTAAMGATLPLLARFATERLGAAGNSVGTLYAVNTAGAVFGTALAGFVLLPELGLFRTTVLAAAANLVLGGAAILMHQWVKEAEHLPPVQDLEPEVAAVASNVPVAAAMALAGFASLVYEVAWFRLLGLMLGASVYAFSTMLLAFLIGIAIGGKLGGPTADLLLRLGGRNAVLFALAATEAGIALLSFLLMFTFGELPFWYVWLFDLFGAAEHTAMTWWVSLVLAGFVMTPPAVLMGAAFPLAVRAVVGRVEALGGPVGQVYGWNTLGAVAGAALAGFVLLPTFWVQGTVLVAAGVNLFAAAILTVAAASRKLERAMAVATAGVLLVVLVYARPTWDPLLMTGGMYKYVTSFSDHSRAGILDYARGKYELLYYSEGLTSVVTVAKNASSENIWLANNGKVDASTTSDMPTQLLCALLPLQYVEDPDRVLLIGLASGITAGSLTLVDDLGQLEVVEIEPTLLEAARVFEKHNYGVVDNPEVRIIANDGRNHVLLSPPETYDVIISEPSNPWITGVSNLFTKEFLEMGKTRLKPGGVWSQWVQLYGMGPADVQSLLATFAAVYPNIVVYMTIDDADLVLVGSDRPLSPSDHVAQRMLDRWPRVRKKLESISVESGTDLTAMYLMGRDEILDLAKDVPLNTDDNMRIEYSAPGFLLRETQDLNHELLRKHRVLPYEALDDDPLRMADLAEAYWRREDEIRAVAAMARAAMELPEGNELREEYLGRAKGWAEEMLDEEPEEQED